jgi:hypothetical protein
MWIFAYGFTRHKVWYISRHFSSLDQSILEIVRVIGSIRWTKNRLGKIGHLQGSKGVLVLFGQAKLQPNRPSPGSRLVFWRRPVAMDKN